MKSVLLITLSLVLALVGWSTAFAEEGFYVVAGQKANFAPVPKTGQTYSDAPKDDGDIQKGVAWPSPRFKDNNNGTVTDNLTGLTWTKNAITFGTLKWTDGSTYPACEACTTLNSGEHGLTDGSIEGDWRLPNVRELMSLLDFSGNQPALPANHPFTPVNSVDWQGKYWWTSTTGGYTLPFNSARTVFFYPGEITYADKSQLNYVWCVRGGK